MSEPSGFECFVLSRIARNPALISESPRGVAGVNAPSPSPPSPSHGVSTLEAAHKKLLAHFVSRSSFSSASSPSAPPPREGAEAMSTTPSLSPAAAAASMTLLQRAIVDTPLLPLAGEHFLYEALLQPFITAAAAARQLREVTANQRTGEGAAEEVARAEEALATAKAELSKGFKRAQWLVAAMTSFIRKTPAELKVSADKAAIASLLSGGGGGGEAAAPSAVSGSSLKRSREE